MLRIEPAYGRGLDPSGFNPVYPLESELRATRSQAAADRSDCVPAMRLPAHSSLPSIWQCAIRARASSTYPDTACLTHCARTAEKTLRGETLGTDMEEPT